MKLYLAGPEVFLANASDIGAAKKALCEKYGFIGLFPLDCEIQAASPHATGLAISVANEALIRDADAVVANLTPFRSPSADVGTVYELGLARGLGKPIHGYSNTPVLYTERVKAAAGFDATRQTDAQGMHIEAFELHDNLMIDGGIHQSGGHFYISKKDAALDSLAAFERVLQQLAADCR